MDTSLPKPVDGETQGDPPMLCEPDIRASLEESRQDIAAVRIVPGYGIVRDLLQAAARIQARRPVGPV